MDNYLRSTFVSFFETDKWIANFVSFLVAFAIAVDLLIGRSVPLLTDLTLASKNRYCYENCSKLYCHRIFPA